MRRKALSAMSVHAARRRKASYIALRSGISIAGCNDPMRARDIRDGVSPCVRQVGRE